MYLAGVRVPYERTFAGGCSFELFQAPFRAPRVAFYICHAHFGGLGSRGRLKRQRRSIPQPRVGATEERLPWASKINRLGHVGVDIPG